MLNKIDKNRKIIKMDEKSSTLDDQSAQILTRDLVLLEKKRMSLQGLNESYNNKCEQLKAENLQLDQSIELISGSIQDNEQKKVASQDEISQLRSQNDQLIKEINKLQAMKKATAADLDNTNYLIDSLLEELETFRTEKSMALDRIQKMKKAIKDLTLDKERKLPKLKKYDAMLKKARGLFQETKSRMDISLKLSKVLHSDEDTGLK